MCACGKKRNQATASPEELVSAAQQRADERRAALRTDADTFIAETLSQSAAIANASSNAA